jgi:hypothetical protein
MIKNCWKKAQKNWGAFLFKFLLVHAGWWIVVTKFILFFVSFRVISVFLMGLTTITLILQLIFIIQNQIGKEVAILVTVFLEPSKNNHIFKGMDFVLINLQNFNSIWSKKCLNECFVTLTLALLSKKILQHANLSANNASITWTKEILHCSKAKNNKHSEGVHQSIVNHLFYHTKIK